VTTQLLKFKTRDPRRNLPPELGRKRAEANFVIKFMEAYLKEKAGSGFGGKHFELSGFGIADFVWIACRHTASGVEGSALTLERLKARIAKHQFTAFEMKLTDWRKGLSQAYRYGFFADRAILLLPPSTAARAVKSKELFQQLGVGLWSFDTETREIRKLIKTKLSGARNSAARAKALDLICRRFNFGKLRK
jgi:hypothetical protein